MSIHISGGKQPHEPIHRLPDDLYDDVERNIAYACTDVTLRDPATGKLFLGFRQTEPQTGPWFIGGRNRYSTGVSENAALQVKNDLGISIPSNRFKHVGTYSTEFPVAGPGREDHGRHTVNATMVIDLYPEEVEQLNQIVAKNEIRDEYSSGGWYDPDEIAEPTSDYPYILKQFVRDLHAYDLMMGAIREEALAMHALFNRETEKDKTSDNKGIGTAKLVSQGLSEKDALIIGGVCGRYAEQALDWAELAIQTSGKDAHEIQSIIRGLIEDKNCGDVQIVRRLTGNDLTAPEFVSENGPALRFILRGAIEALNIIDR